MLNNFTKQNNVKCMTIERNFFVFNIKITKSKFYAFAVFIDQFLC